MVGGRVRDGQMVGRIGNTLTKNRRDLSIFFYYFYFLLDTECSTILLTRAKPVLGEPCGSGSEKQSRWTLPRSHHRLLAAECNCIISVALPGKVGC